MDQKTSPKLEIKKINFLLAHLKRYLMKLMENVKKLFIFVWSCFLVGILFVISKNPIHFPKELSSYWPVVACSIIIILLISFLLLVIKRTWYKNEKMPKGETLIGIGFMIIGISVTIFAFLHSPHCL